MDEQYQLTWTSLLTLMCAINRLDLTRLMNVVEITNIHPDVVFGLKNYHVIADDPPAIRKGFIKSHFKIFIVYPCFVCGRPLWKSRRSYEKYHNIHARNIESHNYCRSAIVRVVPVGRGGRDTEENLRVCCKPCANNIGDNYLFEYIEEMLLLGYSLAGPGSEGKNRIYDEMMSDREITLM
jgi:hypothetical protein